MNQALLSAADKRSKVRMNVYEPAAAYHRSVRLSPCSDGARRRRFTSRHRSLFPFLVVLSVLLFTPGFISVYFCVYIGHLLPALVRVGLSLYVFALDYLGC